MPPPGSTTAVVGDPLCGPHGGTHQHFTGIEFLNGNPLRFEEQNEYRVDTRASAGDLRIASLSLTQAAQAQRAMVYRDFAATGAWTPYLGAGLGAAQAELTESSSMAIR